MNEESRHSQFVRDQGSTPDPVLLIIADISGYTRYMTANAKTLSHSQTIITELIEAIIREIQSPVEVAKLEGDAVFLFCRKSPAWGDTRLTVGQMLLSIFRKFSGKLRELSTSTICTCDACKHLDRLTLKIIVHSGEALFHRVLNFTELAGTDVIILHRLLKNSVQANQYFLLTEAARQDLELSERLHFETGSEVYDDIGKIKTLVYFLEGEARSITETSEAKSLLPEKKSPIAAESQSGFGTRFAECWRLYWRLWFAPITKAKPSGDANFHHLVGSSPTSARLAFAILTILLTPFMLLVGSFSVLGHSLVLRSGSSAAHHHPPGCACKRAESL